MSESTYEPGAPAEPRFAGGGGTEPDLDQTGSEVPTPDPGGGVDLKTTDLPDDPDQS